MQLLEQLCAIPGTSGDESRVRDFLIQFFQSGNADWKQKPTLLFGPGFQDNLLIVFGVPKLAFYAHMDTVGYTIRYDNYVVPIGGIDSSNGDVLVYESDGKHRQTRLVLDEDQEMALVDSKQTIPTGTTLTYQPRFTIEEDFLTSPYLDNRLAIWSLLKIAPTAENVAIAFTTFEEHGGGGAGLLAKFLYEKHGVAEAIITDITWATNGVLLGKGPAISMRDSRIPRKAYLNLILEKIRSAGLDFQLEVESQGGSDGREIQNLPYPIDWCFIGPPSENQHTSREKVHLRDVDGYLEILRLLGCQSKS